MISIHLMFLLITGAPIVVVVGIVISIHLMFLLITKQKSYGMRKIPHFNTSHVSINRFIVQHNFCIFFISIHLMFLLIKRRLSPSLYPNIISIHLMFLLIFWRSWQKWESLYFNTSHVSINLRRLTGLERTLKNFNTSHVSINPT